MSRVEVEILIGILLIAVTSVLLIGYGLNEEERMARFELAQQGRAIEEGAALYDINCKGCHGPQGEGIPGLCPPLNDSYFFNGRLEEVGWSGSMEDYIISTASGGRLVSTRPELYPGQGSPAMPAWSDALGGPLRGDQIDNIATFIINWESTAPDRSVAEGPTGEAVGTDITRELSAGDVNNGSALADSKGCTGCHVATATGPAWFASEGQPGIGDRAESRLTQADYTGQAATPEQYLFESIVNPNVYVVEGFQPNIMLANYGETLTVEDVSDLIAYMLTIK
jgi:mono/diheme cytochrome c family protein